MRGTRPTSMRSLWAVVGALSLGVLLVGSAPAGAQESGLVPIVFVHGAAGSAAQYQTQAKRFASNGYPASSRARVRVRLVVRDEHARAGDRRARRLRRRPPHGVRRRPRVPRRTLARHDRVEQLPLGPGAGGEDREVHRHRRREQHVDLPHDRGAHMPRDLAGDERDGQRRQRQRPSEPADARAGRDVRRVVRGAVRVLHGQRPGDDARPARASRPGANLGPGGAVPAERRAGRGDARDLGGERRHRSPQGGRTARRRSRSRPTAAGGRSPSTDSRTTSSSWSATASSTTTSTSSRACAATGSCA